ncbi:hypothetical protein [Falsiroseomonas sp. HW251]|uniref:hypothetical protein n=1 Tax=Falsiroseomonas sp. HW251 TaxID=3390998 RepID=UPI003D315ED2
MSAQLHPHGAPPPRAAPARQAGQDSDPGEVAFDCWLRQELARLYDTTLSEPVPDELARLLLPGKK